MSKILIIEDEPLVARMYQRSLSLDNFDVVVALGGNEGLEKVKTEKPDIVLLDIMMPEPNGMEVLEKLSTDSETKHIPVVIFTNLSGTHDADLAKSKGAVEYWVKKDVDPKDLGLKVKDILDSNFKNNPPVN